MARSQPYKGPFVIQAVTSDTGSNFAHERRDKLGRSLAEPRFYFKLACGHEWETKTRKDWRGKVVAVPQKADARPCAPCTEAFIAAGKPIPPCGLCKGRGEVEQTTRVDGPRGASVSWRRYRCPACHGKTAPPVAKAVR